MPIIDRRPVDALSGHEVCSHSRRSSLVTNRRRSASIVVAFMVTCGALVLAVTSYSVPTSALDFHLPFSIVGDSEFESCTAVSGGSGTASDPYIISAWEIYGTAMTGVYIQDTTAHFVIRDLHINSTADGSRLSPAIQFENVSNATVERVLINATFYGMVVIDSDNITISDVEFDGVTGWDIDVARTDDFALLDSHLYGQNGLTGWDMSRLVVMSNDMGMVDTAVTLSTVADATVEANVFSDCGTSVNILDGDNCSVLGNSLTSGTYGILMTTVQMANVSGNVVHEMAAQGILLDWHSLDSTIFSNAVSNCSKVGIAIADALGNCTVSYNVLRNNSDSINSLGGGVRILDSVDVLVHHNMFYDNTPRQGYDSSGGDNSWSDSYPSGGNYWNDYSGVDVFSGADQTDPDSDGIGDTHYSVDADTDDEYPLVDSFNMNTPPSASFTATPATGELGTQFDVDASGCYDGEDSVDDLQVRWDWDGDGIWDTSYTTDKTASHAYMVAGDYTLRMQVLDTGGLTSISTRNVEVTDTAIPEFTSVVVPVLVIVALFMVASRRRR